LVLDRYLFQELFSACIDRDEVKRLNSCSGGGIENPISLAFAKLTNAKLITRKLILRFFQKNPNSLILGFVGDNKMC
jgi:hypothetical protein